MRSASGLDLVADAREMNVHVAGAAVVAGDHDLVDVEPDEPAGDRVGSVVDCRHGDGAGAATAIGACTRVRAARASAASLPKGAAVPWPSACTRSYQASSRG